ncbi:glycosyltransferase family 4 protein [Tunicatimonas pelagia]|uniref:glycosyltransferase family 4 protein n=1 Tax=Tunicatimonas pelagia TaxID=931531 RepID=UPI0026668391|nr:glycosyltransferase family 4 protein [Tunicatimonas pelagia]WKN44598.1 glycosyltransferase family 4 protein [Tunicatimonas pelagia]
MQPPWYFVLPKERDQPSGGNIYNERIILALQETGQSVEIILADDYRQAIFQNKPGTYWVDTLILESIQEVLSQHPSQSRSLLIVHHLASLAPPVGQSAEELRAKEKPWLDWFQGFLATSHFTKDYLRQQHVSQPVVVAEPGIDVSVTNVPKRTTKTVQALMVANLVERKGILPWLQWLAEHVAEHDQFSLTIVGRLDIERHVAQKCISMVESHTSLRERITIVGSQLFNQMTNFYQTSNLFISVATMETFGMALQEARTHQLPILTLDGGYSAYHLLSGQSGYVFSNLTQLGSFFLNLIRKPAEFTTLYQRTQQHPASYVSWGQTARSLVQQFDPIF